MNKHDLCETNGEVTRVAGGIGPPVIESILHGRTQVGGAWTHAPFEADVHPMQDHVIAVVHAGSGKGTAIVDSRRTVAPIRPAAFSIIPRGHGGYWAMTGDCCVSHVYLGDDRLRGCADLLAEGRTFELLDRAYYTDPKLYAIMKIISDEAGSPGPHGLMYLEHAIDLLCVVLLRAHSTLVCPLQRQRGLAPWQVKRVVAYMRERLGMEVTLQELASIACLSRFHFCKAFRGATGMAPYEYLTRLRMRTACELLKATPLSIRDVGAAVGYVALSTFSTAFRRYAGVSPRAYRNALN
jgi:AraC family transcriptional regulator